MSEHEHIATVRLCRAARADRPSLGRDTFWTPSLEFAQAFARSAERQYGKPYAVYAAEGPGPDDANHLRMPFGM